MILLIAYFLLILLIIFIYGNLVKLFLSYLNIPIIGIGEIGLIALPFLLFLSILIHFILPINLFVVTVFFIFGFSFFFLNFKSIIFIKNSLFTYLFFALLVIFIPYILIFYFHDDYNYYHLPYLNYLKSSKIIFGLVNINTPLAYPQNSWLNLISLFRISNIGENTLHITNAAFFFFYILYNLENILKTKNRIEKFYLSIITIISFSLFSRLRDFGLEIIPQLILLVISHLFIKYFYSNKAMKNDIAIKILILSATAIILRISSFTIVPLALIIVFFELKNFFIFRKKNILIILFLILFSSSFFTKNIINSGCFLYPISSTCFHTSSISWATDKEIAKKNKNLLHAFSRGWMIYAKQETGSNDKFLFNPDSNILTHSEYLDKGITNWIHFWLKDYDISRILNIALISIFIVIIISIFNIQLFNTSFQRILNRKYISFFIVFLLPIFLWFFISSPALRYGGYAAVIPFFSLVSFFIIKIFFGESLKIKKPFIFLFSICIIFFLTKNITRLSSDLQKDYDFTLNIPYPIHVDLEEDVDYKIIDFKNSQLALRFPTSKLFIGNLSTINNYQLHCGNIKNLCLPEKKISCIKDIKHKYSYRFFYNDPELCLSILNINAHY